MADTIGAAVRCCVLACCVLTTLSETTVTQQSSSAWGSVEDGRTVDRGTHVSHTTDVLPDEPELTLQGRFGGFRPRQPPVQPVFGHRGGFGGGSRRRQPEQQVPQQPPPSTEAAHGASEQPFPSVGSVGRGTSQQPFPSVGSVGRGTSQQPLPGPGAGHQASHQPLPSLPTGQDASQQPFPAVGVPRGGFQQPFPGFGVRQNPFQQQYPTLGHDYAQQAISSANAINDAYRRWLGQYPTLLNTGAQQSRPVFQQEQQPDVGLRGGFDSSWQQYSGPVTPPPNEWRVAGVGPSTTPLVGAAGQDEAAVSSLQPQNPAFQVPDINSFANQWRSQAWQNIARGMTLGTRFGGPATGGAGVQPQPTSRDASQPNQPRVQSQHASVDSFSFQPSSAIPDFSNSQLPFPSIQAPSGHFSSSHSAGTEDALLGHQAAPVSRHADNSVIWRPYYRPGFAWPLGK